MTKYDKNYRIVLCFCLTVHGCKKLINPFCCTCCKTITGSVNNLFQKWKIVSVEFYVIGLSCFSCIQHCDPMDCSPPGSSVHGILQARMMEWVALLQGVFPTQGLNPHLLHLLHWQVGSLPLEPPHLGILYMLLVGHIKLLSIFIKILMHFFLCTSFKYSHTSISQALLQGPDISLLLKFSISSFHVDPFSKLLHMYFFFMS